MQITGPISAHDTLAIYLQDHHAGAQGGLALARRTAKNHRGSDAREALEKLVGDIEEDEAVLRRAMEQVGVSPSIPKGVGAMLAERVGRYKLNGQLRGRSPLSSVIELEALLAGVTAKRHVWMVLRDHVDIDLTDIDPVRMIERAEDQLDLLHELWGHAAAAAFTGQSARRVNPQPSA